MKTISELSNLEGRVSLITGGAGHVGSAMAEALAEVGAKVILVDYDAKAIEKTTGHLRKKFPNQIFTFSVDLEKEDIARGLAAKTRADVGKIDILINCAALVGTSQLPGWCVSLAEQSIDTFERCLNINLVVPFLLTQMYESELRASRGGSVVNISSIYGLVGPDYSLYGGTKMGNAAAYAASKGGLVQLTRWFATTLAPQVRVNTLTLGGILRGQPKEFTDRYSEKTPLKRMGTEEDMKGAIVYLASDLSRYVTGQNIVVDGGWTIW